MSDDTPGGGEEPAKPKRKPKDSEFFELPPDLRKMTPGELPATAGSSLKSQSDEGKAGESPAKKGCLGLLLVVGGGIGWLARMCAP